MRSLEYGNLTSQQDHLQLEISTVKIEIAMSLLQTVSIKRNQHYK